MGIHNIHFDFNPTDIHVYFIILNRYWVGCVHQIKFYYHRNPQQQQPCFCLTDFMCIILTVKLPLFHDTILVPPAHTFTFFALMPEALGVFCSLFWHWKIHAVSGSTYFKLTSSYDEKISQFVPFYLCPLAKHFARLRCSRAASGGPFRSQRFWSWLF